MEANGSPADLLTALFITWLVLRLMKIKSTEKTLLGTIKGDLEGKVARKSICKANKKI